MGWNMPLLMARRTLAFVDDMKVAGKTGTAASANNPGTHGLLLDMLGGSAGDCGCYLPEARARGGCAMAARAVFANMRK